MGKDTKHGVDPLSVRGLRGFVLVTFGSFDFVLRPDNGSALVIRTLNRHTNIWLRWRRDSGSAQRGSLTRIDGHSPDVRSGRRRLIRAVAGPIGDLCVVLFLWCRE